VAAVLVGVVIAATPVASAADEYSDAAYSVALTNETRAAYGSAPLAVDASLEAVAYAWAAELASNGYLAHNPNLAYQVDGWWWLLGENVGVVAPGGGIEHIHRALVASPSHYANLIEPDFEAVGVGIAYGADGRLYLVQVFADF
jgi:uncharacterized protein YkwD